MVNIEHTGREHCDSLQPLSVFSERVRRSKSDPRRSSNVWIVGGSCQSLSSSRAHLRRAQADDACQTHDRCRFLSLGSGESSWRPDPSHGRGLNLILRIGTRSRPCFINGPFGFGDWSSFMQKHVTTTVTVADANAALAYKFWLARCFRDGSPEEDLLRAVCANPMNAGGRKPKPRLRHSSPSRNGK